MRKLFVFTFSLVSILLLTSCGPSYYVSTRPYGYIPDFSRTFSDRSVYRPSHYRNFIRENNQYQQQSVAQNANANAGTKCFSTDGRSDEVYLVKSYLDTHSDTGKPVYHTTYTTSYNDNGEVTTTYTTDYVGTKKEEQYWEEVKKEQKKMYKENRKRKKVRVNSHNFEDLTE